MNVNKAEIVISAVSEKQYPETHFPEIALAGRSNVGKSSFINKMINRKNLVRTSSKPGKTRTLNFYNINDTFHFVDVPGYGYAKVSKQEQAKWGKMMEEYFQKREQLRLVVLIVDIRHKPTNDDVQMYNFTSYLGHPTLIVATKLDKVPRSKRDKQLKQVRETFTTEYNDQPMIVPFSAETAENKDKIWSIIEQYV